MNQPWKNRIVGHAMVSASDLTANPANWRTHPKEQTDALTGVLDRVGWVQDVVVNKRNGHIVDGHARVEMAAARREQVPVIHVDLSPAEERLILATYDRLTAMAGTDDEKLAQLIADVQIDFPDLNPILAGIGDLLQDVAPSQPAAGLTDPDEAPAAPAAPVTRTGDLWLCGPHRVLCGDCMDRTNFDRLFCRQSTHLVFTSPPYAEQREYDESSGFRPIPPSEYISWYSDVAANIRRFLADDGSYFLNIKPSCDGLDTELYVFDLVLAHVREWGFHFATEFCWERNGVPKSVTQRFKNQFEPVYQFALGRWKMRPDSVMHFSENVPVAGGPGSGETSWANKQGGVGSSSVSGSFGAAKKRRNGTSKLISDVQGTSHGAGEYIAPGFAYPGNRLPTFAGTHEATGHTAAFPVGLPEFFIKAYTDPGDIVFDPFMGSGSTLIAAERNQRVGLGLEISPAYIDIIVRRWQDFTGQQATLDGDGRTFAAVAAERQPQEAAA